MKTYWNIKRCIWSLNTRMFFKNSIFEIIITSLIKGTFCTFLFFYNKFIYFSWQWHERLVRLIFFSFNYIFVLFLLISLFVQHKYKPRQKIQKMMYYSLKIYGFAFFTFHCRYKSVFFFGYTEEYDKLHQTYLLHVFVERFRIPLIPKRIHITVRIKLMFQGHVNDNWA